MKLLVAEGVVKKVGSITEGGVLAGDFSSKLDFYNKPK